MEDTGFIALVEMLDHDDLQKLNTCLLDFKKSIYKKEAKDQVKILMEIIKEQINNIE
jgi:hypothetical protein